MAKKRANGRFKLDVGVFGGGVHDHQTQLPMSGADAKDAEAIAARALMAANAQLDFSGSRLRLRAWDLDKNEHVKFVDKE